MEIYIEMDDLEVLKKDTSIMMAPLARYNWMNMNLIRAI